MAEILRLKKYANRRLYDTEKSAYVTLNQVADAIKQGRLVEVIDAQTEEDVTAFILTQILLEASRRQNTLLPIPLLHLIIQHGENVLEEFFENYLQQTIQNYLDYKKAVDEQFKKWLELGMDLSEMAQKSMSGFNPFQSLFDQFSYNREKQEKKGKKGSGLG